MLEKLQSLYDSEINFTLSCFWDGGFHWQLGDEMNGFKREGDTLTLAESVAELCLAAHEQYPDSAFHLGREEFDRRRKALRIADDCPF
jgi:hypothetical protein